MCLTLLWLADCSKYDYSNDPAYTPASPSDIYAVPSGSNIIKLYWNDNSAMESGFYLYISTNQQEWGEVINLVSDTETYRAENLIAGRNYYFKLTAFNDNGLSGAVYTNYTAGVPAAPTDISFFYTNNKIIINWQDNSDNEDGFHIYQTTIADSDEISKPADYDYDIAADGTTCTVSDTVQGQLYFFWIEAYNDIGIAPVLYGTRLAEDVVWSDEFEGTRIKSEYWSIIDTGGGFGNNEKQFYSKRTENIAVSNGYLWITARKEDFNGYDYTSAKIQTKNRTNFQYGRIEACLTLPYGRGTWPAFWMLGENIDNVGWPYCGEIDIMEHVGYEMNKIHGTIHTGAYNHLTGTAKGDSVWVDSVATSNYIYAVEWTPEYIAFFVNNNNYFTVTKAECGTDFSQWPFNNPCFLILNLAIGGDWGGALGIDNSIFPQTMAIDYVRVYSF
ncbi:MAG TPA: family 16 glycosylhydrolase [Spirochaetota bacterium]|nr:family 16 glycosylhydrolase [Spirochaetota bacterium]